MCKLQQALGRKVYSTTAKFGERAFSYAGPAAWNSMPEHIRAEPDIRVFRKLLKTQIFLT